MTEFIFLFLIIILIPRKTKKQKKFYCIVVCTIMCCLVGLRNINIGQRDTLIGYGPEFFKVVKMSYIEIFSNFKDPIFYIFTKAFHIFSNDLYMYLFVFGIPYNVAISYIIYKYSNKPALSYFTIIGLSIWKISFTGMRHVLAAAFLIFSLDALIQHKIKLHWLLIILAMCFHSSALIFFIVYPLSKIKNFGKYIPLTIIIAIIAAFFRKYILLAMNFIFQMLNLTRYSKYSEWLVTGNGQGYLINLLILLFLLYFYGKKSIKIELREKNEHNLLFMKNNQISYNFLLMMQVVTLFFNACAIAVNEFARIGTFFGVCTMLLIPSFLNLEKNKKQLLLINAIFCILFAGLFLVIVGPRSNIIPYYFNWETYK